LIPNGYYLAMWSPWRTGWRLTMLGVTLNMAVCARNHWLMPALSSVPLADGLHVQLSSKAHLVFLADIIGKPNACLSIGDVFIVVGLSTVGGLWLRSKMK